MRSIKSLKQRAVLHIFCCILFYQTFLTTREAAFCIILVVSVCLSVCQTITFESLDIGSSYLHIRYISREQVYEGYRIWRTSSQGRMVWLPSLARDRKWPHVTKCTHSRVVGLRLEANLVLHLYLLFCLIFVVVGRIKLHSLNQWISSDVTGGAGHTEWHRPGGRVTPGWS